MSKYFFIVFFCFSTVSQASQKCLFLKEIMNDEKMGDSKICRVLDQCFFTSDEGDHKITFEVPCSQFNAVEKYVGKKK